MNRSFPRSNDAERRPQPGKGLMYFGGKQNGRLAGFSHDRRIDRVDVITE